MKGPVYPKRAIWRELLKMAWERGEYVWAGRVVDLLAWDTRDPRTHTTSMTTDHGRDDTLSRVEFVVLLVVTLVSSCGVTFGTLGMVAWLERRRGLRFN